MNSPENIWIGFGDLSGVDEICVVACDPIGVAKNRIMQDPRIQYGEEVDHVGVLELRCDGCTADSCVIRHDDMPVSEGCRASARVRLFDKEGVALDDYTMNMNEGV